MGQQRKGGLDRKLPQRRIGSREGEEGLIIAMEEQGFDTEGRGSRQGGEKKIAGDEACPGLQHLVRGEGRLQRV